MCLTVSPPTAHALTEEDDRPTVRTQMLSFTLSVCFVLLLRPGSACAFSLPSATTGGANTFQHRLVEHTDQLQQRRQHREQDDHPALVPPPHLFCIPAPGGNICLVVDEKGAYHAVRDACPPLGVPLSQIGVVDTQVGRSHHHVAMTRCGRVLI